MTTVHRWITLAALAGLALAGPGRLHAQDASAGIVQGVVRAGADAASVPLPYAMVELVAGEVRRAVLADSAGRYQLRDVPPGMGRVRARHIGHAVGEVDVLVPSGAAVEVDLQLARQPVVLPAMRVVAAPITLPQVEPLTVRPSTPAW